MGQSCPSTGKIICKLFLRKGLIMANQYNNYNNNRGYRYNNYNNNRNNNYRSNNRPQNENRKPVFDASKYKKPDIEIKGLSGKKYFISGNCTFDFASVVFKTKKQINELLAGSFDLEDRFPQIYEILKEWMLKFLNYNVDGITYTVDEVDKEFNDLYVMYGFLVEISKYIAEDSKDTQLKTAIMQDQEELKNNGTN